MKTSILALVSLLALSASAFAAKPLVAIQNTNGAYDQALTVRDDGSVVSELGDVSQVAQLSMGSLAKLEAEVNALTATIELVDQQPDQLSCNNTFATTYFAFLNGKQVKIGENKQCHTFRRTDGSALEIITLLNGLETLVQN